MTLPASTAGLPDLRKMLENFIYRRIESMQRLFRIHNRRKRVRPYGIKCGVIGAGNYFRNAYASAFSMKASPLTCSAIYAPNKEKARIASRHIAYSCDVFDDIDMFFKSGIECSFILTPNDTHFELASMAAKRGLHVFCEKPLCNSVEQIHKLHKIVRLSKTNLMVGFGLRHDLRLLDTGRMLTDKIIGRPCHIDIWQEIDIAPEIKASSWLNSSSRIGGGALHHLGIHAVNLLCSWFGPAQSATSQLWNATFPPECGEDHAVCHLTFSNYVTATLHIAMDKTAEPRFFDIIATGTAGTLQSKNRHASIRLSKQGSTVFHKRYKPIRASELVYAQIKEFAECIASDRIPSTDIEDSLQTQKCIELCYQNKEYEVSGMVN